MRGPDGAVRPHWQVLDRALNAFGPGEMWRRWEQARQLIRQHGVSFNVYGDARGLERPWPLDPVPVRAGARRVRGAGGRARAAGDAARSAAGRPLRAAAGDRRGAAAARGGPGAPGPAARLRRASCRRAGASCTSTPPIWCARPRATCACWPIGRRRRPGRATRWRTGSSLGRVLPEAFRDCHAQRLALVLPHAARDAGGAGAARAREPAHRAADRRAAQRDLLRAGVPGAVPRLPAGRGRRSDGARRARVPEDAGRAAPGRRHPAPAATTTTAIRWSCAPSRCWACRACCRRRATGRSRSPTRWARAWCRRRR